MNALQARLVQLANQAGRVASLGTPSDPRSGSFDDSARARLRALLAQRHHAACEALPGVAIAPGVQLVETVDTVPLSGAELASGRLAIDPIGFSQLVFLDTETTGLAVGTGTKAFVVGLATLAPPQVRIRQWLLTRMAGEGALLHFVAEALPPDPVLVTYNGKSYDLPLLRTRYRMNRLREPFGDARHLDLLHPVRRRYRGIWPNCRLTTVETQLLGTPRVGDLPGSEAPAAWRRFLATGETDGVRRVLTHNARDLSSLAQVLYALNALD